MVLSKNFFLIFPPISISLYKLKILYKIKSISFYKKLYLLWKQCMFIPFLVFSNFLWYIDELLFPNYKNIQIKNPIFLLGGFRTGTTIIHRELYKKNNNFISPRFLELLFPFLIIHYFLDKLEEIDKNYNTKIISKINSYIQKFFGEKILKKHNINFYHPEEDDILLSTYMGLGWYNIVQFPLLESWEYIGNIKLTETEKYRLSLFYHRSMQKILYRRGKYKQLLNKSHLTSIYPIWKKIYHNSKFIFITRNHTDSFNSWILLNQYTNERFFNIDYKEEEYREYHLKYWKYLKNIKKEIKFIDEINLEDFCKDNNKILDNIIRKIEINN